MNILWIDIKQPNYKPDTTLKKKNIDLFIDELEDQEDRNVVNRILDEIIKAQKNEYHFTELYRLRDFLKDPRYKLHQIVSTLQGLLMRLRPSSGGKRKKNKTH